MRLSLRAVLFLLSLLAVGTQNATSNEGERERMVRVLNSAALDLEVLENAEDVANESIIIISYLAAISMISSDLESLLRIVSNSQQGSSSSDSIENGTRFYNPNGQPMQVCVRAGFEGSMISGSLEVAIEEINGDPSILPNHTLAYLFANTCADEKISAKYFMEHWKAGARAFIGPEMNCRTEAAMANSQNLPIISYKCKDQTVSDKNKYQTFARTVPAETDITKAFISLLKHYGWKKFSTIFEAHTANEEMFAALRRAMEEENRLLDQSTESYHIINTTRIGVFNDINSKSDRMIENILIDTKDSCRIYVTFGTVRLFRKILEQMGQLGMTENQQYMLIYLDTDYNWLNVYYAMNNHFLRDTRNTLTESWDFKNSTERKIVEYAKAAIAIIPTPVLFDTERFKNFWSRSNEYLGHFGVKKDPIAHQWSIKVNRFGCYLYDAVVLYAKALHELFLEKAEEVKQGYDPTRDGVSIINKIIGRRYQSMLGFDMRINENGDAIGNYTLLAWQSVEPQTNKRSNNSNSKFQNPEYYPLDKALDVSAVFVDVGHRLPEMQFSKPIQWTKGKPPRDEPECGFYDEKCKEATSILAIASLVLLGMAMAGAITMGGFCYKSRKYEMELSMIWRINPDEVQKIEDWDIGSNKTLVDVVDLAGESFFTGPEKGGSGLRGIAFYRGAFVAIKEIKYSRRFELTRQAKIEMRQMRQLVNPNVNAFMGIFIGKSHSLCVVREFCAKGSLMDILKNKEFKFNQIYSASFTDDLLKGLIYIHESELKVHGNLKSTNCLITARWVLQLADYGTTELRDGQRYENDEHKWNSYLWSAPEVLRTCNFETNEAVRGSQKGDSYSFGIILHEIVTRNGPYNLFEYPDFMMIDKLSEVIRRVAGGTCFRPSLEIDSQQYLLDVMSDCWAEDPLLRPDIKEIRNRLKPMFRGVYKRNITDHMIAMMEQYQVHLEQLVAEKTESLLLEQKKTSALLMRMLPRSVADQLLSGKLVRPEHFSSVTIYFSDIVGFTTLSGESTPMQVVRMLNKLYTLFDLIIGRYKVYKVETIGDAYMVVSGLPELYNGHAVEIATMALQLLREVETFSIPHRPGEKLQLRIGIHSGSCVAGVVGRTMPRYCLFGDTVNTASRMESNGAPGKIHLSTSAMLHLPRADGFIIHERGTIDIKGKGQMRTYWLVSRVNYLFPKVDFFYDDDFETTQPPEIVFFGANGQKEKPKQKRPNHSRLALNMSTMSLQHQETSFFKRMLKRATNRFLQHNTNTATPAYSALNGGVVSMRNSFKELPSVLEEGQSEQNGNPFASSANAALLDYPQCDVENEEMNWAATVRKRSSSLPDAEALNGDLLAGIDLRVSSPVRKVPSIATTNTNTHNVISDSNYSIYSSSPSPSQYPSYVDLDMPLPRKDGMTSFWPSRKRSLSVGDHPPSEYLPSEYHCPIEHDPAGPLLSPVQSRRGRRKNPERKSLSSLQHSLLRDPSPFSRRFRDVSPFRMKPFWCSSTNSDKKPRQDSFNRIFRRLGMGKGSGEYSDLNNSVDDSSSSLSIAQSGSQPNSQNGTGLMTGETQTDHPLHSEQVGLA